jgi:hypothetical protein
MGCGAVESRCLRERRSTPRLRTSVGSVTTSEALAGLRLTGGELFVLAAAVEGMTSCEIELAGVEVVWA